jgi:hypothetical protein
MRLFHPCKNCLVQPLCKKGCYKYNQYHSTYADGLPLLFWISSFVVCALIVGVLIFMFEGWSTFTLAGLLTFLVIELTLFAVKLNQVLNEDEKRFERRNIYEFR